MAKPLVAGNWKMNGLKDALENIGALATHLGGAAPAGCDVCVCPPATLVAAAAHAAGGTGLAIGGQDCHGAISGAHTGDVSAEMLADAGASYVIVGHSERRTDHGETDVEVNAKALAAHRAGLAAIVCIGETEAERDAGETLSVLASQLDGSLPAEATPVNLVIGYEPVWAIGTGRTPSLDDIAEVHGAIRKALVARYGADAGAGIRILYGGSVKAGNAEEIFAVDDVDGGLVGGASLDPVQFADIVRAAR